MPFCTRCSSATLGLRCAREVDRLGLFEQAILDRAVGAHTQLEIMQAGELLLHLGTEASVQFLRSRSEPVNSAWSDLSVRLLVALGDPGALDRTLEGADMMMSFPGRIAGGDLERWWWAPPQAALDVARRRFAVTDRRSKTMTVRTLAHYGTQMDLERVLTWLEREEQDEVSFVQCAHALFRREPRRTIDLVEKERKKLSTADGVRLDDWLVRHGAAVDVVALTDLVLWDGAPPPDCMTRPIEGADEDPTDIRRRADWAADQVLAKTPIDAQTVGRLLRALDTARPEVERRIWRIAKAHSLPEFDEACKGKLRSSGAGLRDVLGHVADFARSRAWPAPQVKDVASAALLDLPKRAAPPDWDEARVVLWCLDVLGDSDDLFQHVKGRLAWFAEVWSKPASFAETLGFAVQDDPGPAVPIEICSRLCDWGDVILAVASRVPTALAASLLRVDVWDDTQSLRKGYSILAQRVTDEDLDCIIASSRSVMVQSTLLAAACRRGVTPWRSQQVLRMLEGQLDLWDGRDLLDTMEALWSDQLAEHVLRHLGSARCDDPAAFGTLRPVREHLCRRLTHEQVGRVLDPLIETAGHAPGRERLEIIRARVLESSLNRRPVRGPPTTSPKAPILDC